MIRKIHSCSFTGHRPRSFSFGFDENSEEFQLLQSRIRNAVIQVCNLGCRTFYCGMAEGADLWCAEIVLDMKNQFNPPLKVIPVIPFLAQSKTMSKQNLLRYRRVMKEADVRYLVSPRFTKLCFLKRNRFLVDRADALIAIYREGATRSGTAQTMRFAKQKGKKIFNIMIEE